jgi:hypothetical protein
MKISNKTFVFKAWHMDLFSVLLIIALNPITYFINSSLRKFSPDTIAYITMARDLFSNGLLYIPAWGHADTGLILPPLYPFLIAFAKLFSQEGFRVAEYVSSGCMLSASIPIFFYVKKLTNRIIAILSVALIQTNYFYFYTGLLPLSESSFLLTMSLTLYLIIMAYDRENVNRFVALSLGLSSALVFFARQIGIVVFMFLTIWHVIHLSIGSRERRPFFMKNLVLLWTGFLVLAVPYTLVLYHQTGQMPHKQNFRAGKYVVSLKDNSPLTDLEKLRAQDANTYRQAYAKRRHMRKLLPDSSEMYSRLYGKEDRNIFLERFFSYFQRPEEYFSIFLKNLMFLKRPLGAFIFYLFLVLCISPFVVKSKRVSLSKRLLFPTFIAFYLAVLSCLGAGIVGRYVFILFPFVLMHITIEVFTLLIDLNYIQNRGVLIACFGVFFVLVFYLTSRHFQEAKVYPKFSEQMSQYQRFKNYIRHGEPAFSLLPGSSYLAGATFRVLPNDSLEKVAKYGKRTGVRWLLVDRTNRTFVEKIPYNNAQWHWSLSIETDYPDLISYRSGNTDGSIALYEIL